MVVTTEVAKVELPLVMVVAKDSVVMALEEPAPSVAVVVAEAETTVAPVVGITTPADEQ